MENPPDPQTGGTIAKGGTIGSGGSSKAGGAPGTGGHAGKGGATGVGGRTGTGGAMDTGGSGPAGGAGGSGGSEGTGGKMGPPDASASGGGSGRDAGRDAGRDLGGGKGGAGGGGKTGTGGSATGGATGGTTGECTVGPALTGGTDHCSSNDKGKLDDGFQWTIWSSGGGGCIHTYGQGCAFKATWNNSGDFLARAGYQWDSSKTHKDLGTISADYAFKKSGSGGSYSYIGIYGWTENPLVEFYIVEDSFGKPTPGSKAGTITVDGDTYIVYKNYRTNAPSIRGNANFDQYYSVRQTLRQCGHISLSTHFSEWEKLGLKMGKMYEAKILAEAGGGSGTVDFTSATMSIE